jgi:hypothetical protein
MPVTEQQAPSRIATVARQLSGAPLAGPDRVVTG